MSLTGVERETRKEKVLAVASTEALKYGIGVTGVATAATLLAVNQSQKFAKRTSLSAKIAIPIMAGLAMWSFKYEVVMKDAILYPERYGIIDGPAMKKSVSKLPIHQRAMNYIYDHPFQFVSSLGVPLATTILFQQRHNTHLTLSQKIMHSRVFAQGGVIAILLTTMAFREFMDGRGRYEEPSSEPLGTESDENK